MSTEKKNVREIGVSRRQFLGGAGAALAAGVVGGMSLTGSLSPAAAEGAEGVVNYDESIKWDAEYEAVVVGFGFAGATASITAADQGVQRVLLLDKAPYGSEGGNSKVCEQYCLSWSTEEDGIAYLTGMAEGFSDATPEVIKFMAKGGVENWEWVKSLGIGEFQNVLSPATELPAAFIDYVGPDYEIGEYAVWRENGTISFSEYPILANGQWNEGLSFWGQLGGSDNEEKRLWRGIRKEVVNRADKIDIWLESPAIALIQEPESKTVLGVKVNRKGTEVNVRALNGVALTCGSIEANKEMMQTFVQRAETYPIGSTYNTGDGVKMGMAAGAEMWRMAATSGPWMLPKIPNLDRCYWLGSMAQRWLNGFSYIHVDGRGKRFMPEHGVHKHGHIRVGDSWQSQRTPHVIWSIFDKNADTRGTVSMISRSLVIPGKSPEELAAKIGLDPDVLARTISDYNSYCETGVDLECCRDKRTLQALDTTALFAVRLYACNVNAQAGPRRNTLCEVVDPFGKPIPGLYSAGELGSFWAGAYECGGNVAECLYTGRQAGKSLTTAVEIPQAVVYTLVESDPTLTGNDVVDIEQNAASVVLGPDEYLGTAEGLHGIIRVKVKYVDGKIVSIEIIDQVESPELTEFVWEDMPEAMIDANSPEVDTISGATISSHGLIAAVEDAISQA